MLHILRLFVKLLLELVHQRHDALVLDARVRGGLLALELGAVVEVEVGGVRRELAVAGVRAPQHVDAEGDADDDRLAEVVVVGLEGLAPDAGLAGVRVEVAAVRGGHAGERGLQALHSNCEIL